MITLPTDPSAFCALAAEAAWSCAFFKISLPAALYAEPIKPTFLDTSSKLACAEVANPPIIPLKFSKTFATLSRPVILSLNSSSAAATSVSFLTLSLAPLATELIPASVVAKDLRFMVLSSGSSPTMSLYFSLALIKSSSSLRSILRRRVCSAKTSCISSFCLALLPIKESLKSNSTLRSSLSNRPVFVSLA